MGVKGVFLWVFNEQLKDELTSRREPPDLDSLITLAIRLDNRQWGHCPKRSPYPHSTMPLIHVLGAQLVQQSVQLPFASSPEPM